MGIVKKQAFWNSVVSYAGIGIGFLNTSFLFPIVFDADQFGLTRILSAIAVIYMQLSALGARQMLVKFIPLFKGGNTRDNGLLLIGLLISLIGFSVFTLVYILAKEPILGHYKEQSTLFIDNYHYAIPLTAIMLLAGIFEGYLQGLYQTVLSNFMKNVGIRIVTLGAILLYWIKVINFDQFLLIFVYSYVLNVIVLGASILKLKVVQVALKRSFLRPRLTKYLVSYSLFSVLSGISSMVLNRIDIVMIGFLITTDDALAQTGVYALAVYFGTVVYTPAQSISRISYPILSQYWKSKNMVEMLKLYRQTSSTQLLTSGLITILIWANIDNYYVVVGEEYAYGKMAILWLIVARLFHVSTGCNGQMIMVSRYFRFDTVASVILVIITIVTNIWLIPLYGITGAAIATAISVLAYNVMKVAFLWIKLGMQPFTGKTLVGLAILTVTLLTVYWIPEIMNPFVDTGIRSIIICAVFVPLIYFLKVSEDVNESIRKTLKRFGVRIG